MIKTYQGDSCETKRAIWQAGRGQKKVNRFLKGSPAQGSLTSDSISMREKINEKQEKPILPDADNRACLIESIKILHLTLHRQWFDAIASGEKKFEFRALNRFWCRRLFGKKYDEIHFRNGYNPACPWMRVEFIGLGLGEWQGKIVFALQLGKILELKNYDKNRTEKNPHKTDRDAKTKSAVFDSEADGFLKGFHEAGRLLRADSSPSNLTRSI